MFVDLLDFLNTLQQQRVNQSWNNDTFIISPAIFPTAISAVIPLVEND